MAAVRLGLRAPAYSPSSFEGLLVSPFGTITDKMGVNPDGERLVAIDGRPIPADAARRAAAMTGREGAWVTLTLRRTDGSLHRTRVVRSDRYEREAFAGSGLDLATRRTATFLLDLVSRMVGLTAAFALFVGQPRNPVAMLFFVAMLLNGFPAATSGTMWPGLGSVVVVTEWLTDRVVPEGPRTTILCDRYDRLFPIQAPLAASGLRGWLLVGRRPDGSVAGRDEREALGKVAVAVANAIVIARKRERSEADVSAMLHRIDEAISGLRDRVGLLETATAQRVSR